jgi:two-component system response regulator (stage 0 sporulation protein A)
MVNMEMIQISATLNFMGSTLTHVTFDRDEFFKLAAAGKVDLDPIYTQADNNTPSVVTLHPAPTGSGKHDIEIEVTSIMHEIGIPAHIKGYQFLRDAIIMVVNDPGAINAITRVIYPSIAFSHDTTPSRAERAIRHAIEVSVCRGKTELLNSIFGRPVSLTHGKPTNSEFIALIADNLRLRRKMGVAV